eukprot:scaffold482_cov247-Pinguiococcus_pyrenoidosus.AAC.36
MRSRAALLPPPQPPQAQSRQELSEKRATSLQHALGHVDRDVLAKQAGHVGRLHAEDVGGGDDAGAALGRASRVHVAVAAAAHAAAGVAADRLVRVGDALLAQLASEGRGGRRSVADVDGLAERDGEVVEGEAVAHALGVGEDDRGEGKADVDEAEVQDAAAGAVDLVRDLDGAVGAVFLDRREGEDALYVTDVHTEEAEGGDRLGEADSEVLVRAEVGNGRDGVLAVDRRVLADLAASQRRRDGREGEHKRGRRVARHQGLEVLRRRAVDGREEGVPSRVRHGRRIEREDVVVARHVRVTILAEEVEARTVHAGRSLDEKGEGGDVHEHTCEAFCDWRTACGACSARLRHGRSAGVGGDFEKQGWALMGQRFKIRVLRLGDFATRPRDVGGVSRVKIPRIGSRRHDDVLGARDWRRQGLPIWMTHRSLRLITDSDRSWWPLGDCDWS